MHLAISIVRQFVVSLVLLSVIRCSSAVRYSRSMRYLTPSIRNHMHQWKYVPFSPLPRSMQRRFMWRDVDDTVEDFMGGVTSGARVMTQIFNPSMGRYRKPMDYDTQSTTKIKYVIKKPPPAFKRMKMIKFRAPKKTIPLYHPPLVDIPSAAPLISMPSEKPNLMFPYISEDEIRKIEKEQEQRVESAHYDAGIHEHSHQTHMDADVISGRINEFGEGWSPIQVPFSTPKAFAVSQLHTKVEAPATVIPSPTNHYEPNESRSYEVTEHSAEESVQKEHAFKPSSHFDFLRATTELPNYPEYFLKNIQSVEEQFQPTRIYPTTTTTTTTTTSFTPTLSNRLPPRSTTERPFKRYNLHRPKSSKLFFNRPSGSPDSTKQTTSIPERSTSFIAKLPNVIEDVIKTTRETIRTTREPTKTTREPTRSTREPLRTTKETPKVSPPKVRTIRNDSEAKIKIKNAIRNESLNTFLNRGTVKFGEKQS